MPTATDIHMARLKASSGLPIRYCRHSDNTYCELTAVPATSTARLIGSDGSFVQMPIDDWLVSIADFEGFITAPDLGDVIWIDDSNVYRVNHPDEKTPVFENFNQLDRPAKAWRIHTFNPA